MAALRLAALLAALAVAQAQVYRTDNSPVCNTFQPQCQARCKQGQEYMFVCSAGNGPNGGPYVLCQCVAPSMPVGPPSQVAKLALATWPGSRACNDKTWINDCTSTMTAQINGSSVIMTPSVSAAFHEACDPVQGIVIGPKGTQAAVSFPQYPIGLTSTGPDGSLQIDFAATAGDDPNQMDWSQCVVTYKIVQGTFLNPQLALSAANVLAAQQSQQAAAAAATAANAAASSRPPQLAQLLLAALLVLAACL